MIRACAALILLAGVAQAEDMADAPGATLRLLDKLTGETQELDLQNGQSKSAGRITVQLDACRYPAENTTAEAFAHVTVMDASSKDPVFNGWMVATSPALSALDHPRYDVWVLRCDVPELALPKVAEPAPAATEPTDG